MSLEITPGALTTAAGDLTGIGNVLTEANAAAAVPTTTILPAAADEVSTAIAALFGAHGQFWQALAAQSEALHQQFVQTLAAASDAYLATEHANAVGLGENLISLQLAPSVSLSSSIPYDVLLALTNTGIPVVGPALDRLAIRIAGAGG